MEQLLVIKIGGNVIDNAAALQSFLEKFSTIKARKRLEINWEFNPIISMEEG